MSARFRAGGGELYVPMPTLPDRSGEA